MDAKAKKRADELIREYGQAGTKYRLARIKTCELQATLNPHASEYWTYMAVSLR